MVLEYIQNAMNILDSIYQNAINNNANMSLDCYNAILSKNIMSDDRLSLYITSSGLNAAQEFEVMKWYKSILDFKGKMSEGKIGDPAPFLKGFLHNEVIRKIEKILKDSLQDKEFVEEPKRTIGFQNQ